MTAYSMSKMAAGIQPRVLQAGPISVLSILAFQAVALTNGDNIDALKLESTPSQPANGPTILDVSVDVDQLDTGNTLSFTAGDTNAHARFISASTVARTGGIARANVAGTMGYQPFASSFGAYPTSSQLLYTLQVWITATATTPQAGTMRVKADFTYDP